MLFRRINAHPLPATCSAPRKLSVLHLVLFGLPGLLFLPVFFYSFTTPFALVDDYGMCYYVEFLDNPKRFFRWFEQQVLDFSYGRYRPFFDLYNMVTWKAFGATPWLHHLTRWVLHFCTIVSFSAAFICISGTTQDKDEVVPALQKARPILLPLAFLVYVWLFFPNSPASRLGPQEVFTVFFLGLCTWMVACILVQQGKNTGSFRRLLPYGIFYVAYLGLSLSKEINIAVMLWILVFYLAALPMRSWSWRKAIGSLPLVLIFFYTFSKIYIASKNNFYGVEPITIDLLTLNATWIFTELFQINTAIFITAGFIILLVSLLVSTLITVSRNGLNSEVIFLVFLLGQFVSLYLILCTSWAPVLRYWYILIPVFSTLLAFGVQSILVFTNKYGAWLKSAVSVALVGFIIYFIGSNYYNFLQQTIAQHSLRQAESRLIAEVARLSEEGEHIEILKVKSDPEFELVAHLISYYRRFSPRFQGRRYKVDTAPPRDSGKVYYLVTMHEQPGNLDTHMIIEAQQQYRLLHYAYTVAGLFQGKTPYLSKDAGVHLLDRYRWIIYRSTS